MIDLHCHILPGLDDGPANVDFSVAMARAAVEAGIHVTVATPHVRSDHPNEPDAIADGVPPHGAQRGCLRRRKGGSRGSV